jgi:hypothetical protein
MMFSFHASGSPPRSWRFIVLVGVVVYAVTAQRAPAQNAIIDVGSNVGKPGDAVDVVVSLATFGGVMVAATSNDLTFNKQVLRLDSTDCRVNLSTGKSLSAAIVQETRSSRTLRLFVQSIFSAPPIHDGPLYTCTFHIAPTALPRTYPITITTSQGFGPTGVEVPRVTGSGGSVEVTLVLVPSVTRTPTRTATPTPSPTPTLDPCPRDLRLTPSAGASGSHVTFSGRCYFVHSGRRGDVYFDDTKVGDIIGDTLGNYNGALTVPSDALVGSHVIRILSPREIAAAPFEVTECAGDCNGDGMVGIDDLMQVVNIVFGDAPLSSCASVDSNRNGVLTIDELLSAVQRGLRGCSVQPG